MYEPIVEPDIKLSLAVAEIKRLKELMKRAEWQIREDVCPWCIGDWPRHHDFCEVFTVEGGLR